VRIGVWENGHPRFCGKRFEALGRASESRETYAPGIATRNCACADLCATLDVPDVRHCSASHACFLPEKIEQARHLNGR